ncbi:MAG TPA: hypothetical protein VGH34_09170 [Vicinamibacterales bacterium]|jgi:hydroxypyruvate isomerase
MTIETAVLIEQVNARIDAPEASLRVEIRGGVADAKHHAQGLHGESKEYVLGLHEEARRHAHVLNESVRDDIRILAEALATVLTRLDAGR